MFKRVALVLGSLFAGGCAALLNSGRAKYRGPVVQAVWHNSDVRVAEAPLIHDGVVYVNARPWSEDRRHLFAFDLKTGKQLWVTSFSPERILLAAGPNVFVADAAGGARSFDAKTGQETAFAGPGSFLDGAFADGILYIVGKDGAVRAMDGPGHSLWSATVPVNSLSPPVPAGGVMYVRGYLHVDELTPDLNGVYAFDARTGVLRWKWETKDHWHSFGDLVADAGAAYLWVQDRTHTTYGNGLLVTLDAATGKQRWTHATSIYTDGPALQDNDIVIVCDYPPNKDTAKETGYVYRGLKRATGEKAWEATTSWKYDAPRTQAGALLYVSDRKVHEVLTENNNTSPDSWLTKVDLRTGKELWRSEVVELGVFTQPVVGDGMVVVGSEPFTWADPPRSGKHEVAGLWAWRVSP